MKLTTGKTIVSLNDQKKQLLEEVGEYEALLREVKEKKLLLEKSIDEYKKVSALITLIWMFGDAPYHVARDEG